MIDAYERAHVNACAQRTHGRLLLTSDGLNSARLFVTRSLPPHLKAVLRAVCCAAHQLRPAAALGQVATEYARVCAALQEHCAGLAPWRVARQRYAEGEDPLAVSAAGRYGARGASGRTAAGLLEANKARRKWQRTQPPLLLEALSGLAGGGYASVGSWLSSLPNGRRRVVLRVAPPAVRAGLGGFVWLRRLCSAGACACVVAGTPPPAPALAEAGPHSCSAGAASSTGGRGGGAPWAASYSYRGNLRPQGGHQHLTAILYIHLSSSCVIIWLPK
jgi:hypothetical protein